jgi:ATP-dependent Zn protease
VYQILVSAVLQVPTPDYIGRKEILDLYLGKVLSKDVDVEILARGTTGFTGADLENMVNQAALRAAIDGADSVTMKYLENARDKVLMGMQCLQMTVVLKRTKYSVHACPEFCDLYLSKCCVNAILLYVFFLNSLYIEH